MTISARFQVVVAAGAAVLLLATPSAWPMQSRSGQRSTSAASPQLGPPSQAPTGPSTPSPEPVAGRVWVGAERLELPTRVWLAVENRQDQEITGVTFVDFDLPGFSRTADCWPPDVPRAWPSCLAGSTDRSSGPWTIGPHSSLVLWAEITRSSADPGRFVVSGVFEWSDTKGRHRSQLQTAPLDLVGTRRPLGLPPAWLDLAKDLFLPVTLLGLGFLWQWLQQRRNDRQAVWATMLEKSHNNAERFYMPIESAIQTFDSSIQDVLKRHAPVAPEAFDEATLWLLLLVKRHRVFVKKIGGYYFKNRIGEFIAGACWDIIYFRTLKPLVTRALLDSVVDPMDPFETQAALQERCAATPAFANNYRSIRSHLMTWAGFDAATNTIQWDQSGLRFDLHTLTLWSIVLEVEMNRPEKLWYGAGWPWSAPDWTVTSEEPVSTQLDQVWAEIQELLPGRRLALPEAKLNLIKKIGSALDPYKRQLRN